LGRSATAKKKKKNINIYIGGTYQAAVGGMEKKNKKKHILSLITLFRKLCH
jgi:hypothetical protein